MKHLVFITLFFANTMVCICQTTPSTPAQSKKKWTANTALGGSFGAYQLAGLSIFAEALKPTKNNRGVRLLSLTAGTGYVGVAAVTAGAGYLTGVGANHFEISGNVVMLASLWGNKSDPAFGGALRFGYRFQRPDGGIMLRVGLNPTFFPSLLAKNNDDAPIASLKEYALIIGLLTPQLGIGYSF